MYCDLVFSFYHFNWVQDNTHPFIWFLFEFAFSFLPTVKRNRISKMAMFWRTLISLTTITSCMGIFIGGEQDVGSPLRVAQCRATCLEKVSFRQIFQHTFWLIQTTLHIRTIISRNFHIEARFISLLVIYSTKGQTL